MRASSGLAARRRAVVRTPFIGLLPVLFDVMVKAERPSQQPVLLPATGGLVFGLRAFIHPVCRSVLVIPTVEKIDVPVEVIERI